MDNKQLHWFEEWFDSPYYDLLYSQRNEKEAAFFIDNLLKNIPSSYQTALDLACGKGRHSIYLHKKGFQVTGSDLSKRSIECAKTMEKKGLEFIIQDMRIPILEKKFELIVNLFTSFGYFENELDNVKVLRAVHKMLVPDGTFVLDYLNGQKLARNLVNEEKKHFGEINFLINRTIENGHVVKKIELTIGDFMQRFQEKVRLFDLQDFETMFENAGLKITNVFGDYSLGSFNATESDRIILIATH